MTINTKDMKNSIFITLVAMALTFICSCTGQKDLGNNDSDNAETKVFCFKDSCQHLVVSLSLELPMGTDEASMRMRDSLVADFIHNTRQLDYGAEDELNIATYTGDMTDYQAIVDHYGQADYAFLLEQATADYNDRMQYIEEDTTLTEADKQSIREDVPQWTFELSITEITDTLGFAVYQSQAYVYYGGAHGGVTGSGAITFNKSTGEKIDQFLKEDATNALQPLIRQGLLHYYAECGETMSDIELNERLMIEEDIVPLPVNTPYPNATGDSLIFTYRQYEVACYADGMPSFKLSTTDLMPFLTEAGKSLINFHK